MREAEIEKYRAAFQALIDKRNRAGAACSSIELAQCYDCPEEPGSLEVIVRLDLPGGGAEWACMVLKPERLEGMTAEDAAAKYWPDIERALRWPDA